MDTRKIVAVASILAIALVAVSAGYAYTATTVNSGNTASTEYITIIQNDTGAYQFAQTTDKVYWNSEDYKVANDDPFIGTNGIVAGDLVTKYTLYTTQQTAKTISPGDDKTYTVAQVGKTFNLHFTQNGGTVITDLTCSVTSDAFTKTTDGTVIFLEITSTGHAAQYMMLTANKTFNSYVTGDSPGWTGSADFKVYTSGNNYVDATVTVYYGYQKVSDNNNAIVMKHTTNPDAAAGPSVAPVNGANLKFTIDTGSNLLNPPLPNNP